MPIYPKAVYKRPPGMTVGAKRKKTDAAILHVDAGGVRDLYGWWNNPDSKSNGSHFQVAYDGTVFQYADTDLLVYTSGSGSQRSVGIETQGKAAGPWTPEQLKAIDELLDWLCRIYDLPRRLMTSSKASERGIGYHLLGVPGNPAQKATGVSQTGGQLWSSSVGKVCPGPDRVKQMPGIITRLNNTEEDDMFTDKDREALTAAVTELNRNKQATDRVLGTIPPGAFVPGRNTRLVDGDDLAFVRDQLAAHMNGNTAGLLEAINQLAAGKDIDVAAIAKAAEQGASKGVENSLAGLETTATISFGKDGA